MELSIILIQSLLLILVIIILFFLIRNSKKQSYNDLEKLIKEHFAENSQEQSKILRDEFLRNRTESLNNAKTAREELSNSIKLFGDQLFNRMTDISKMQKNQLDIFSERLTKLTESNEKRFDKLRELVASQLKEIQENNSKKLEEMRLTVDEKLHNTLEKRLGESFKLVSSQLKSVYEGLGEMQKLANGVGDLKRVLTNVKTRGTWGEVQLGNLIEQILAPEQYAKNVSTKKGSTAIVEYAIKMPGRDNSKDNIVWLPIDAKFPLEDYQKLLDAQDNGNSASILEISKFIERRIKQEAKTISDKYLDPPHTTDFAIMFLPIEGLYAEVLRRAGLTEHIQREYRVILAGPTNLAALLNSLQMGFRTLAIEKRSSEVWKLLSAVKNEFGKFGEILEKTQQKLDQASKTINDATKKTRTIERKLRDVQELPADEKIKFLE